MKNLFSKENPIKVEITYLDGTVLTAHGTDAENFFNYIKSLDEKASEVVKIERPKAIWMEQKIPVNTTERFKYVEEKFKEIVTDKLGLFPDEIVLDSNLATDCGADSLDVIEIVMESEKEFNISISDEDWESCSTVKNFIDMIIKGITQQL